jgi:hypothetical protein
LTESEHSRIGSRNRKLGVNARNGKISAHKEPQQAASPDWQRKSFLFGLLEQIATNSLNCSGEKVM